MRCSRWGEFHRSFKPLLCIVKISGLLSNELREVNGNLITRRNTVGLIRTVAFITFYSGVVYFMNKNDIIVMKLDGLFMVMENIQLFAFEVMFYIVVLSTIIRQKEFLQIIKHISKLDSLLVELREEIDYRKEFKRNLIFVGSSCTIIGSNNAIQFLKTHRLDFEYILHTTLWISPSFLMYLTLLQFTVIVFSMKLRCSKLKNAVSRIIKLADERNWNLIPRVEIEYHNSQVMYRNRDMESTIWDVSVVYDIICDICKTINKVFAFQTTFGLGAISIFLTFAIYDISVSIKDTTNPCEWGGLVIGSVSFLMNIIIIFGIIYCCSSVKTEVDQVAVLLHKVKPDRIGHSEVINTFSLQSMHQKVQFTACGLFKLDYTFIYLVISTISTYVVILVQFGRATSS